MANDLDVTPAPYGRWPDGTPITQLEASAKQMDDWATAHGFSGSVRMGIGTQYDEPERWSGVKIGTDRRFDLPAAQPAPPLPANEPLAVSPPLTIIDQSPEPNPSWFRRLLNFFKGAN